MNHWLLNSIEEKREYSLHIADKVKIYKELLDSLPVVDYNVLQDTANALELAVLDLILDNSRDNNEKSKLLTDSAVDAFRIYCVLPPTDSPLNDAAMLLRMSALAVLGDKVTDAVRLLNKREWNNLPVDSDDWGLRTKATIIDVWLRVIRKKGWGDRDIVLERVAKLRKLQEDYEKDYLDSFEIGSAKGAALELIVLYHLAKAAEIFALFITEGRVDRNFNIKTQLDSHFDKILEVCKYVRLFDLEPLTHLLSASSKRMIENSIWTVTRAVNTRVSQFVRTLVDRGKGDKAIFDVLPPQRRALAERGLLGSSRRAVVVSLPTSSGKTLIAQFRILQALNQFDAERGWLAYLVPTRTLVNQISRQLRRDFSPLDIAVERVSPALEVDSVEMSLLTQQEKMFRVLVTTPEKLDLLIRQGWEAKIGRPLTLVVVDEAHNIQNERRGLRLELLLATINKECERAQFLLLTPFISNAREIAQWLDSTSCDDISLSVDWQPNDRVIGITQPIKGELIRGKSFDYSLTLESIHTTRNTININEQLSIPKNREIADTYAKAKKNIASITAQYLNRRGPVIVMHSRPDFVWSLAEKLKLPDNYTADRCSEVELVQDYLRLEMGDDFQLIDLLNYGIGVHHAGLSDDIRTLIEWLFVNDKLKFLLATTTIAQGVNFPVSSVVMASHQYPCDGYCEDMPPEDFWNIAGRAGRVNQGDLGVIVLAADGQGKADILREFILRQTGDLNSALIKLAVKTQDDLEDLGSIVYKHPEWSTFLQYLTHTYRQMGEPESFTEEIEQVLRGTLGFEKLRLQHSHIAQRLLRGIEIYTNSLSEPSQPIKLVDSTGFSLQSIKTVLHHRGNIQQSSWDKDRLFSPDDTVLREMMGVLLRVPEIRDNLKAVTGGETPDGSKLSLIIKDWVNGESIPTIAERYFQNDKRSDIQNLTKCGQNIYGKLTQAASWGLGALLAITASGLPEEEFKVLSNLPSRVFYGVNRDEALSLRLLGVPRLAATSLANAINLTTNEPLPNIREKLVNMNERDWVSALGQSGSIYRKVWRVLEDLD